jgi:hypothetical protein
MGYSVLKYLVVTWKDKEKEEILLERKEYGWNFLLDIFDKEDPKMRKQIEYILNDVMDPIVIYDNNDFKNKDLEKKYKDLFNEEEIKNMETIVKVEKRVERG